MHVNYPCLPDLSCFIGCFKSRHEQEPISHAFHTPAAQEAISQKALARPLRGASRRWHWRDGCVAFIAGSINAQSACIAKKNGGTSACRLCCWRDLGITLPAGGFPIITDPLCNMIQKGPL